MVECADAFASKLGSYGIVVLLGAVELVEIAACHQCRRNAIRTLANARVGGSSTRSAKARPAANARWQDLQ
jgi:hypothetical protein